MADQPTVQYTPQGSPSFFMFTKTRRGRLLSSDHFAVRANDYRGGWRDGEACAREYMQYLVYKESCMGDFPDIVRSIASAMDRGGRHGAATGFARAIETILRRVANDPGYMAWIEHQFPSWEDIARQERRSAALIDRRFQRVLRRIERGATRAKPDAEE